MYYFTIYCTDKDGTIISTKKMKGILDSRTMKNYITKLKTDNPNYDFTSKANEAIREFVDRYGLQL